MAGQPDDGPHDGDFASYLERRAKAPPAASPPDAQAEPARQTLDQVLPGGEEPTREALEEFRELAEAPDVSDEELTRQALEAGGEDGDPDTPE